MVEEPDEVLARIEDDVRRVQRRAEAMPRLQAAIDAIRVGVRSDQRDISVEVDASGRLTDLELTEAAFERGAPRVSSDVLALVAKAQRQARARTLDATSELLGADDPVARAVQAEVDAQGAGDPHGWVTR